MLLNLLSQGNYLTVNKTLIRAVGLNEAVIIAHFASIQSYHNKEYFFQTYEKIDDATGIKTKSARKAINNLESLGCIETKMEGIPRRKYYKLNLSKIEELLIGQTSKAERTRQAGSNGHDKHMPEGTTNNNTYNKNKNNNNTNKKENSKKESHEEELFDLFEAFRKEYPGTKRGGKTEYEDFKNRHPKEYETIIRGLQKHLAIQKRQRESKKSKREFVPEWKNLQTYLGKQRGWEERFEDGYEYDIDVDNDKPLIEKMEEIDHELVVDLNSKYIPPMWIYQKPKEEIYQYIKQQVVDGEITELRLDKNK